jgi:hypothetical protein
MENIKTGIHGGMDSTKVSTNTMVQKPCIPSIGGVAHDVHQIRGQRFRRSDNDQGGAAVDARAHLDTIVQWICRRPSAQIAMCRFWHRVAPLERTMKDQRNTESCKRRAWHGFYCPNKWAASR